MLLTSCFDRIFLLSLQSRQHNLLLCVPLLVSLRLCAVCVACAVARASIRHRPVLACATGNKTNNVEPNDDRIERAKSIAVPLARDDHRGHQRGGGVVHRLGGEAKGRVGRCRYLGRHHSHVCGAPPGGRLESHGSQTGPLLGVATIEVVAGHKNWY